MARPSTPGDDPRARHLLRTLIGRYIRDGEPVGSQTLARHAGLDISPATIRNILGDLEEIGLLSSPHTSAGRVPTPQGYRVFVDSLLQLRPLPDAEVAEDVADRRRAHVQAGVPRQCLRTNRRAVADVAGDQRAQQLPRARIERVVACR